MIKFENVEIHNWLNAIRGMRNSWESWDKMDSSYVHSMERNPDTLGVQQVKRFVMGENDYKLALKLSKAGSDHAKYLRQILVSVDIIAPEYWWKEESTYKIGTTENSTSMMHKLGDNPLTEELFSFDYMDEDYEDYLKLINRVRDKWVSAGKIKHSRCPHWRKMNQLMSIAYLYRRTTTLNYQVLKGMYHSRKNHRLQEWHDFASWVESLPYSELITLKVKEQ